MSDSLATAFHIVIETRDGMLLFPSALFWHWALLPKLAQGYRKYHTPLLYVWVHSTTQKITVKAGLDKYITTLTDKTWGFVLPLSLCVLLAWQIHPQNPNTVKIKKERKNSALTGHPHHSQFHCQASPSLYLLSLFLEAAHLRQGEALMGDLSLQWEVPLQAPVAALPPPDTLRKNSKDMNIIQGNVSSKCCWSFKGK